LLCEKTFACPENGQMSGAYGRAIVNLFPVLDT